MHSVLYQPIVTEANYMYTVHVIPLGYKIKIKHFHTCEVQSWKTPASKYTNTHITLITALRTLHSLLSSPDTLPPYLPPPSLSPNAVCTLVPHARSNERWVCPIPFLLPPSHGGLLSLNAWKLSPTPRKIEMVTYTHSNEPDNRCPLEPAVHEVHKT